MLRVASLAVLQRLKKCHHSLPNRGCHGIVRCSFVTRLAGYISPSQSNTPCCDFLCLYLLCPDVLCWAKLEYVLMTPNPVTACMYRIKLQQIINDLAFNSEV